MRRMGMEAPAGLAERVKAILLRPGAEWPVIAVEPATIAGLYRRYVAILAAIPSVCGFLGSTMWGYSAFGLTYRPSIGAALATAIIGYGMTLVGVFLLALVIDALAPRFGGVSNRVQAFKVAAYSGTAAWMAGLFQLVPGLGWLAVLGLYGLYLLYLGLPVLMRVAPDKAAPYTAVTVVAAIVLSLLVGVVTAPVAGLLAGPAPFEAGAVSGTMTVPGVGSVDLGKLEAAGRRMEEAGRRAEAGGGRPVPENALRAMMPATIAGLPRTELTRSVASSAGVGGEQVEAIYGEGERRVTLSITDMGAAAALAALGSAFDVKSSREDEGGYEKVSQIDGRMVSEEYRTAERRGKYGVLVADRFMVSAEGQGMDMASLKAAVTDVGFDRLEALAR